jgi:hypothetical protein
MAAPDINVTPSNSPYAVPAPSVTYGTVTISMGGYLIFPQPTTMTCDTLQKSATLAK